MADAAVLPPTRPLDSVPFSYYEEPADGKPVVTYHATVGSYRRKYDVQPAPVSDARGRESDFNCDSHGFAFVKSPSAMPTVNDEIVKSVAYPECAEILKKTEGATFVHPISHTIRRESWQSVLDGLPDDLPDSAPMTKFHPAMNVHIDQSYDTAQKMVKHFIAKDFSPTRADQLTSTRYSIINIWRPIHQIRREPLAVCDAKSVPEEDLRAVTLVYSPESQSGIWNVKANKGHEWYYWSDMTPEEVILIKCYDSKMDGTARRCPHTAIQTPDDHGPARESVEVRCLVFWEDQTLE